MTTPSDPDRPYVLIPERFGPLMALVRRTGQSSQAIFPNAFDLLCFSAAVGFARNQTGVTAANSNDRASGGEVIMNIPDRKDRLLCDMIAVAHTRDDSVLEVGRLQERLEIFMSYACGGMEHLMSLTDARPARSAVEAIIRRTDVDTSVIELGELIDPSDQE